jgi:hypothetical protein
MKTSRFFRGAATTAMLAAAAMASTALAALGGASCIATDSYVYSAQKYDPTADCVTGSKGIEVLHGSGASANCPATCLTVGEDLYVSTLCPPLPTIATAVDADAGTCIAALAAAATGGTCDLPADGGAATADAADADADAADDEDADTDAASETDAADSSPPPADASDAG